MSEEKVLSRICFVMRCIVVCCARYTFILCPDQTSRSNRWSNNADGKILGHPTEGAMMAAAQKVWVGMQLVVLGSHTSPDTQLTHSSLSHASSTQNSSHTPPLHTSPHVPHLKHFSHALGPSAWNVTSTCSLVVVNCKCFCNYLLIA